MRETAFALGAAKYQVIFGQILPVALPGILTGIILSIGRALVKPLLSLSSGRLSYVSFVPENINSEFTVMPIQIYNWAGRPQEEFHQLAALGIIVLLLILLSLNFGRYGSGSLSKEVSLMTLLAQDFKFASNTKTGPSAAQTTQPMSIEIILETKGIRASMEKEPSKMFPWKFLESRRARYRSKWLWKKYTCFDALIA